MSGNVAKETAEEAPFCVADADVDDRFGRPLLFVTEAPGRSPVRYDAGCGVWSTKFAKSDNYWSPSSGIDDRCAGLARPFKRFCVTDQGGDEMPMIRLTTETMNLIRRQTLPDFRFIRHATEVDAGSWDVPINDEVAPQIAQQRLTPESDDAVVSRLARAAIWRRSGSQGRDTLLAPGRVAPPQPVILSPMGSLVAVLPRC